jgi:16S rRNA (guanine1207-N2)-methyltransferase
MFSHERVDAGSELLASRLPTDFTGDVADFGAGWGYLAVEMGLRSPRLGRMDLYEANHASLEAAKANVASNIPGITARFFWHDLVGETLRDKYDQDCGGIDPERRPAADGRQPRPALRAAADGAFQA